MNPSVSAAFWMDEYTNTILELWEQVNPSDANSVTDADTVAVMLAGIPGANRSGSLYFDTV